LVIFEVRFSDTAGIISDAIRGVSVNGVHFDERLG